MTTKLALVTGAGRGIGRAIALALARRGHALVLSARSEEQLAAVARECIEAGAPACASEALDLSEPEAVEALARAAPITAAGGVEVLVNNAGAVILGDADRGEPDAWDRMIALNLSAPMRLTRRLAPAMLARERGTIINIGSVSGIEGMSSSGAYAATKHGLRGWSLSCYRRLRGYGVKVTLINPAYVDTALVAEREGLDHGKMLRPADVAAAAMLALDTSAACCPEEINLRLTRFAAR